MLKILHTTRTSAFLFLVVISTALFVKPVQLQAQPHGVSPGDIIRSLPTLPRNQQKENINQEKIHVPEPDTVGTPAPNARTIRLSGFESEIEQDIAGYQLVSEYFPLQLTSKDWKRVSEKIWEGYRDLGKLVRVNLVADHNEFIVSISLLRIRNVSVKGATASDISVSENEIKHIAKLAKKHIIEGQVADLFDLKKFLLHMDYRAKEIISTEVISVNNEFVDVNFTVSKRNKKIINPWSVGLDNFGLNGFGKYRLTGRYSAPLFNAGDNLAIQGLLSDGQEFGSARYDFPMGYSSIRGSLWINMLHYKINLNKISQDGQATMSGIDFSYPIFFRNGELITGSIGYEFKGTKDYVRPSILTPLSQKWLNNLHIRASGENFFLGKLSFSGDLILGNLNISGLAAQLDAFSGADTLGSFSKFYWEGQFLQPITVKSLFTVSLKGQFSNKNLDSLEKFSFGGINGVRAYNSDIGTGDEGVLANANYSIQLNTSIPTRLSIFYDHAFITTSHAPWDGEFDGQNYGNHYQLDAAGLQLTMGYKQLMFNATVAYPIKKKPIDPKQRWRLWAQLTYAF